MSINREKFIFTLRKLIEVCARKKTPEVFSRLIRSLTKRLFRQGILSYNGFTYSLYGVWLYDMWGDATFRFCASGAYGFFYSDWLKATGSCVFIDVGANLGIYSLVACKNPNIKRIYSFEPQPDIFNCLNINLGKNRSTRVVAFPYAISEVTEESELRTKEGHSGVATLRVNRVQENDFSRTIKIKKINCEFLNLEIKVHRDEKIAVKIDTEGHEEQVLAELIKTTFWDQVFNIFYEVDERYVNQEKILSMLQSEGFSVIRKIGLSPHYDLMLEKKRT